MSLSNTVEKVEAIFDHKEAQAITLAVKIIDGACAAIQKIDVAADSALPVIDKIDTSTVWQTIVADVPVAGEVGTTIVNILNRYQNFIKAAAADPQILRGLQQRAIAEVTSAIHGVQKTIDGYLASVINFLKAFNL
jgi:hypothetical protein